MPNPLVRQKWESNPLDNHFPKKVNAKPACASEVGIHTFHDTQKLREDKDRRPPPASRIYRAQDTVFAKCVQ